MASITSKKDSASSTYSQSSVQQIHQFDEAAAFWVEKSLPLQGQVDLVGAKNAVLVIMASLILTEGRSILKNVPCSADVLQMIALLKDLGAEVILYPERNIVEIETSFIRNYRVGIELMKKMRASVLVMGPLLARFSKAYIAMPGGCLIGARPIDFHIKNFTKFGVELTAEQEFLSASVKECKPATIVLEYPSVGATENILMMATLIKGTTRIVNAALEPEVMDLISVLKKMGACIEVLPPATIEIQGVTSLKPIEHTVMVDRLEAGGLLLAAAITGGQIYLPEACSYHLEVFLEKLEEMGHSIDRGPAGRGIKLIATKEPKAVSFRTAPYPGFPTDLQAPMMAALCLAEGKSIIHETVFENRLLHVRELQKMGAQIAIEGDRAYVTGVDELYGTSVIATDIRASCALVLAGLAAKGTTIVTGLQHWRRGYEALEKKLAVLGALIELKTGN
jgi:UDP-N-acetylglucosamine 1-carboxyvinyltransferase